MGWSLAVVGLLVVVAGAWIGIRAFLAKGELESAIPLAERTQTQIVERNVEAAVLSAYSLQAHSSEAAALTSDPVWRAGELVPWAGENLRAMRVLAAAVDRVASGAVIPLAEASEGLDLAAFSPSGGKVDLQPIIDLQDPVRTASEAFAEADEILATAHLSSSQLIGPLAEARDRLTLTLDEAGTLVRAVERATQLVPRMLGADGPRDVLLLFQNNAELRSTGGIPGALALLHTVDGSFQLVQQASSSDFDRFDAPVVDLPTDTRALWGDNAARYIQNATLSPQFTIGASVAREMWSRQFGEAPDSVIAVDPVVLSYLLRATGPITLPTGDQLSADNAVQLLLSDVYARYERPADQDAFFASAAAAVFEAVSAGGLDPRAVIQSLVEGGNEHRILIWNEDPEEQALLADTSLAGGLPISDDATQAFGVYLNDMTMSKMDAYLGVSIAAGSRVCREDGVPQYEIDVELTNTAPADAASSLPTYVTGGSHASVPAGNIETSVHVYSAPGTYNLGVTQGGQPSAYAPTTESGYTVSRVTSDLAPGESTTWRFTFLGDAPGEREVVIQSTPMIYKSEVSGLALSCD